MLQIKVAGMSCDHCVASVTSAVHSVAPKATVAVSLARGEVEVAGPADAQRVRAAISDAGYDVELSPGE